MACRSSSAAFIGRLLAVTPTNLKDLTRRPTVRSEQVAKPSYRYFAVLALDDLKRHAPDGPDADQGRREARYLVCGAGDRDHARLPVDDAPRSRCGHVPQHGNGAGEHGGVHGASELRSVCGSYRDRSNPGAVQRVISQVRV